MDTCVARCRHFQTKRLNSYESRTGKFSDKALSFFLDLHRPVITGPLWIMGRRTFWLSRLIWIYWRVALRPLFRCDLFFRTGVKNESIVRTLAGRRIGIFRTR